MKKTSMILFSGLLEISSLSLAATLTSLPKDQINQALEGNTITTIPLTLVNDQTQQNKFMFYLDNQGKVNGKFASTLNNGPQTDQGTYTLKEDGSLCMTWQHWNNAKESCIYIYDTANSYVFVDMNNNFNTVALKNSIQSGNQI